MVSEGEMPADSAGIKMSGEKMNNDNSVREQKVDREDQVMDS